MWAAVLATGGGDLAAQTAWADFAARHPGSAYDLAWHGGLHTAAYSLVSPYAMALFGVVPVTVAAGLTATWLAALLCVRSGVRAPQRPALAAALALWCQTASGRTTFVLGVAFGLAALSAAPPRGAGAREPGARGGRLAVTALCAALSAMASPVAGLFLALTGHGAAARTPEPGRRGRRPAPTALRRPRPDGPPLPLPRRAAHAPGADLAPAADGAGRPRGGAPRLAVGQARRRPVRGRRPAHLRRPLPDGHQRRAARRPRRPRPPARRRRDGDRPRTPRRGRRRARPLPALGGRQHGRPPGRHRPGPRLGRRDGRVLAELGRLGADRTRVEAVMARSHREAAVLTPYVTLARGWNRQADVERGRLFYGDGGLTPAAYRAWLDRWAVGLVVVHDGPPDAASEAERALVADRPAYLEPVWQDRNWRIYRVRDAVPLVDPPARVRSSDAAAITVRVPRPGTVTVRIVDSPWLTADAGCLEPMRGTRGDGFVRLTVRRPGDVTIGSAYFSEGRRCAP
ncbi:integral membrane protein [Streptomyces sp. C]|nr:integral membrane protein [Streptomyces sp. C]